MNLIQKKLSSQKVNEFVEKVHALSVRERAILMVTILVFFTVLFDRLSLTPFLEKQKHYKSSMSSMNLDISSLSAKMLEYEAKMKALELKKKQEAET